MGKHLKELKEAYQKAKEDCNKNEGKLSSPVHIDVDKLKKMAIKTRQIVEEELKQIRQKKLRNKLIMITSFDVANICREIDKIHNTQNQFLLWFSDLSLEDKVRYYFSFDKNYQKKIDMFLLKQLDLQNFVETDLVPLLNSLEPSVFPISISLLVENLYSESESNKEIEELKNNLIDIIQKKEHSHTHSNNTSNIILLMLDKNCGSLITNFI